MTISDLIAALSEYDGDLEICLMLITDWPQYVALTAVNEGDECETTFMEIALRSDIAVDVARMKANVAYGSELGGGAVNV